MAFRMKFRKKPSVGYIISGVAILAITMMVGNKILVAVASSVGDLSNATASPFATAFTFMGFSNATAGSIGFVSGSIIGILGLAAVASFVLGFVRVSLK